VKKPADKSEKYAKSLDALAPKIGLSRDTLRQYVGMPGFPPKSERGYPIEKCAAFVIGHHKSGGKSIRDQKYFVEVEILKIKRDEMTGKLVPIAEHTETVMAFHRLGVQAMQKWISGVSAVTHDAALVKQAERLQSDVLTAWRDMVDQCEKNL
jgi:hypothetical protein